MAKSRFEYVKTFELPDTLLPKAFIVVRIDGRGFHKFTDAHGFEKPSDVRALRLMDRAARAVMEEFGDVVLCFGESDEYSFLIRRSSELYNRRRSKINSAVVSIFTSAYVFHWSSYLPDIRLQYPPTFDSRIVLYPGVQEVRDYFSWRQADTHINNLYNTTFWALIQNAGLSSAEAHKRLQGTFAKDKNEILFTFGINYNALPAILRKGSVLLRIPPGTTVPSENTAPEEDLSSSRDQVRTSNDRSVPEQRSPQDVPETSMPTSVPLSEPKDTGTEIPTTSEKKEKKTKSRAYEGTNGEIVVVHEDVIKDGFWEARPWLLA